MFKKILLLFAAYSSVYADPGFSTDSLVLTEGPCSMELISYKAESHFKFCKDLDQAFQQASLENKSVLLIVVGGNNCPWSEKLLFEIVYKPDFYQEAQKKYVLCKLEVEQLTHKGQELGINHKLEKVPLFILMTKNGEIIAEKEDLPDTPKEVVAYLMEAIEESHKIDEVLMQNKVAADDVLESNYKKAQTLGLRTEETLYKLGLLKKKNIFFLLEKYKKILSSGSGKEVKDLKLDIQRLDPKNSKGAIRQLALMDFEDRSRQKKGMDNPFSALKPLFEYLRDYGHYDKECRWEIEMRIAQFLYTKNQLQAALQHASRSLEWAPESRKAEVSEAVDFLKKQKQVKS